MIQAGREAALPVPVPFRNFVAQARLGISQEEHTEFFRQMLGDVQEPTAPFGLLQVHGEWRRGAGSASAAGPAPMRSHPAAGPSVGGERGERVPLGVGPGAGSYHESRGRGVRHGAVRPHARWGGGRPGAGHFHQHLADPCPARRSAGSGGIRQTQETLAQLLRHEHASLALAQRCSALPGHVPLFSALLNYRHNAADRIRIVPL